MESKKFNKVSKALAIGGVAVGLIGAGVGAYSLANPKTVIVEKIVNQTQIVEVIKEVMVDNVIEVPVNVEIEKIVEVMDEKQVETFCDRLGFDNISDCTEEVMAEQAAIEKVLDFISEEFNHDIADEMEDEGIIADEDDVELVRVYDDFEDIEVKKSDFDDEEYKFVIKMKIEDTDKDVKKYVLATFEVEDNEVEMTKIVKE